MATDIGPKIGIDGEAKFRASMTNINSLLKAQAAEQKALAASFDKTTSAEEKNNKTIQLLLRHYQQLTDAAAQAELNVNRATEQFGENSTEANKAAKQYYDVQAALGETENALDGMTWGLGESSEAFEEAGTAASKFSDVLGSGVAAAAAMKVFQSFGRGIKDVAESSIEFESAFAGVEKTVSGTDEQMAVLRSGIKALSTEIPATATEIAGVAEIAGQLGIAAGDVLGFTKVMIDLGESTNLSAEEAATALAQFMNVAGTAPENVGRLGSAIVALGNNFATNEQKIVEMSQRLASAGTMAGFSEAEILALATAMSSVGIEAEAGGTAMTQTFTAITKAMSAGGDKLNKFARISGMSASEFSTAWKNDAAGALSAFINGLAELESTGGDVTAVLDELGMSGIRQSNMLRSLTLANGQFNAAIEVSNAAWAQNTALLEEASKRYATTESRLQMAANSFENLKAAIGDSFTPQIGALAEAGNELAQGLTKIAESAPGVARGFIEITGAVGAATAGVIAYNAASKTLGLVGFNLPAISAGPWIAQAAGIGLAVETMNQSAAAMQQYSAEFSAGLNLSEQSAAELEQTIAQLEARQEDYLNRIALNPQDWTATSEATATAEALATARDAYAKATLSAEEYLTQTLAGMEPQEQQQALLDNLSGSLQSLSESYMQTYEAAKTSLEGQFSLFQQASAESKYSMEDFFAAMDSQTQYWNQYSANLDLLASTNAGNAQLSAELMAYLNSGTAESVQMAAAFAQGYQEAAAQGSEALAEFIANANAAYEGTQSAMEGAATAIADSQMDIQTAFEDIVTQTAQAAADLDMGDEFNQSAQDTIQGYVNGLDGGPIYARMAEIASKALETFNAGLGVASPSWKTGNSAKFTAMGFYLEIEKQKTQMAKTMTQFAEAGMTAFNRRASLDAPEMRQLVLPAEGASGTAGGGSLRGGNVINVYPQNFNEATIDYLVQVMDARLGAEA